MSTHFRLTGNRRLNGDVPATSAIGRCAAENRMIRAIAVCSGSKHRSVCVRECVPSVCECVRALCSLLQLSSIMQQTSLARHVTRSQWRIQPDLHRENAENSAAPTLRKSNCPDPSNPTFRQRMKWWVLNAICDILQLRSVHRNVSVSFIRHADFTLQFGHYRDLLSCYRSPRPP